MGAVQVQCRCSAGAVQVDMDMECTLYVGRATPAGLAARRHCRRARQTRAGSPRRSPVACRRPAQGKARTGERQARLGAASLGLEPCVAYLLRLLEVPYERHVLLNAQRAAAVVVVQAEVVQGGGAVGRLLP